MTMLTLKYNLKLIIAMKMLWILASLQLSNKKYGNQTKNIKLNITFLTNFAHAILTKPVNDRATYGATKGIMPKYYILL